MSTVLALKTHPPTIRVPFQKLDYGFCFPSVISHSIFLLVLDGTPTFQAKIEDVDVPTRVSAPEAEEIWRTTTANQAFVDSTWERMFWVSMLCSRASDHVTDLNRLFACFYNDFHLNNSWCFLSRTKKNSETYWSAEESNTPKSTRWYDQLYLPSNPNRLKETKSSNEERSSNRDTTSRRNVPSSLWYDFVESMAFLQSPGRSLNCFVFFKYLFRPSHYS